MVGIQESEGSLEPLGVPGSFGLDARLRSWVLGLPLNGI